MSRTAKSKKRRERERRRLRTAKPDIIAPKAAAAPAPLKSAAEPVRGALALVIDRNLRWHLARTRARLGPAGRAMLDDRLRESAVTALRPRVSEVVVRRGRRVVRHVPLLIRTLIIGVRDDAHLGEVQAMPGIAEIVHDPAVEVETPGNVSGLVSRPARLDPDDLQRFVIALASGEIVQPVGIKVGDRVIVTDGPFASFPAIVEAILPGDRIKVAVSIFGRPSPVELGIADVQIM